LTTTTVTEKSVDSCVKIATEVLDTLKIEQRYLKTRPNTYGGIQGSTSPDMEAVAESK